MVPAPTPNLVPTLAERATSLTSRRPAGRRLTAVVIVALSCTVLSPSAGASGSVTGTAPASVPGTAGVVAAPGTEKELARLEKRAAALSKEYRGELIELDEAKKAAKRAAQAAERTQADLNTARIDVRGMAAMAYMHGTLGSIPVVVADDPDAALTDAAVVEHLARRNGMKVAGLQRLTSDAETARKSTEAKVAKVRRVVADLEKQRSRIKALLAKYKPETPKQVPAGTPDGGGGTGKSPLVGTYMTTRMRTLYLAIDNKYGTFPTIGCYRDGDPQDHGSGRACDFMESTGGQMPSAGAQAHGDQVAQFAISNASAYGVKYVIWKQRIYDLRSPGWRAMEDRGGVTANHYDHVHISVF